jgi:hypothetical protein
MENLTETLDIGTYGTYTTSTSTLNTMIGTHGTSTHGTTYISTATMYSTPELLKAIVKKDYIELIYKRQYMVSNGYGLPSPEIYKDIYSRTGGDIRREIGTYVPAQEESYVFDSDLI